MLAILQSSYTTYNFILRPTFFQRAHIPKSVQSIIERESRRAKREEVGNEEEKSEAQSPNSDNKKRERRLSVSVSDDDDSEEEKASKRIKVKIDPIK